MTVALSMAELASAAPTSGGLYYLNINILIASQIIFNSLGQRGTLAVWSFIIITMYAEKRL